MRERIGIFRKIKRVCWKFKLFPRVISVSDLKFSWNKWYYKKLIDLLNSSRTIAKSWIEYCKLFSDMTVLFFGGVLLKTITASRLTVLYYLPTGLCESRHVSKDSEKIFALTLWPIVVLRGDIQCLLTVQREVSRDGQNNYNASISTEFRNHGNWRSPKAGQKANVPTSSHFFNSSPWKKLDSHYHSSASLPVRTVVYLILGLLGTKSIVMQVFFLKDRMNFWSLHRLGSRLELSALYM